MSTTTSSSSSADGEDDGGGSTLIPLLPDDLALLILARLPLSSHPILSLVSRPFHYLLRRRPSALFRVRHLHHLAQPLLCVSLRSPSYSFFLLPPDLPYVHLPPPPLPTLAAASVPLPPYLLLLIGGSLHDIPSRRVQILDLALRRWSLGPSMLTPRQFPAAVPLGRRLYVLGGCPLSADPWAESLDADDLQAGWRPVPGPPAALRDRWMHGSAAVGGKVLAVADRGGVMLDPCTREWGPVPRVLDLGWKGRAAVVGDLICSYDYLGFVKAYDVVEDRWMKVEGLGRILPRYMAGATMADLGGRLCVVWEGRVGKGKNGVELRFAEIRLEKEAGGRLRGDVVRSGSTVLSLPQGSTIAHCVPVML